jgi:hypothetical protein
MLEPIDKATHCALGYGQSFGSLPQNALIAINSRIVGNPESGKSELMKPPGCASDSGARCVKSYCLVLIISGAEPLLLSWSRCRSKERCLYPCGGLVLHVWKHVSIGVQREGAVLACPSCSETTFGDTPAASAIVAAECRKS